MQLRKGLRRLVFLALIFLPAAQAFAAEIQVFAAASLKDALTESGKNYQQKTGDKPVFNFAASSLLARQIQEGAPADLFISADEEKMNGLAQKGLVLTETRRSLLSNSLVVVAANSSPLSFKSAAELAGPEIKRIALAEPQTVPAGIYAKQYLQQIKIWKTVIDRVIPTENVRAALAAVEYGNVDAAIIYKTDAGISRRVRIAYEVPAAEGPKISYPFAAVKNGPNLSGAQNFLKYLESDEGLAVFKQYGFLIRAKDGNVS